MPPAAEVARFVAVLSMNAPEANFRPCETVLNQSPEKTGPANLLVQSRRGVSDPAVCQREGFRVTSAFKQSVAIARSPIIDVMTMRPPGAAS